MSDTGTVVEARPIKTARIANASAALAFVVFVVVAIFMKDANAGAYFAESDQIFTVVLGLIVAGVLFAAARFAAVEPVTLEPGEEEHHHSPPKPDPVIEGPLVTAKSL